jgi:hypothetical protein
LYGLHVDSPELFSMQGFPTASLKEYQGETKFRTKLLEDIEEAAEEIGRYIAFDEKLEELEGKIHRKQAG